MSYRPEHPSPLAVALLCCLLALAAAGCLPLKFGDECDRVTDPCFGVNVCKDGQCVEPTYGSDDTGGRDASGADTTDTADTGGDTAPPADTTPADTRVADTTDATDTGLDTDAADTAPSDTDADDTGDAAGDTMDTGGDADAGPDPAFVQIEAGRDHSCATHVDGNVYCWGDASAPGNADLVNAGLHIEHVAVGREFNCGLRRNGEVKCWGDPPDGPKFNTKSGPFNAITAGQRHTCALTDGSGAVTCWGNDDRERLNAPDGNGFKAIDAGNELTCAIDQNDKLQCWGSTRYLTNDPVPGATDAPGPFSEVAVEEDVICAIDDQTGFAECWGGGYGEGEVTANNTPFISVTCGRDHCCGVDQNSGEATCWGDMSSGKSDPANDSIPYTQVAAGAFHTCALGDAGEIDCWGGDINRYDDDPDPPPLIEAPSAASPGD